jgi:hypothetical protein
LDLPICSRLSFLVLHVQWHQVQARSAPVLLRAKREQFNPTAQPSSPGEDASCICNGAGEAT